MSRFTNLPKRWATFSVPIAEKHKIPSNAANAQTTTNMDIQIQTRILAGFAYAQVEAHESAQRFGWWDKKRSNEELAGILHRDVAKVLEIAAVGDGPSANLHDCTRLEEAVADVIIRALDLGGGQKLDIAPAVIAKLLYNERLSMLVKKDF